MIQELDRVVHQWCFDNDRWMYIEYDRDGEVMGLNFMQGDDYEYFLKGGWCKSDPGLTEFYRQMLYTFPIELKSVSTLTFINKCMWAYHSAISCQNEYAEEKTTHDYLKKCTRGCTIYKKNTTNLG